MDLIKIGKFIAQKRKKLGLTQKQLAEKLGMSDKSISKWERGICLPDVSIYIELCNILEISINEFLAGEEIKEEQIVQKSEENIIGITSESKNEKKRLNKIIRVLILALSVLIIIFIVISAYASYHWFSTVDGNDTKAIAHQVENYYKSDVGSVLKTEKRGNYLATLCESKNNELCMCVFERDSLFKNRWKASGGNPTLTNGEISSRNTGDSNGDTVIIFSGYNIPKEVCWYKFQNNNVEYTCPVDENGMLLDVFIIPDINDINGVAIPLNSAYQEIN